MRRWSILWASEVTGVNGLREVDWGDEVGGEVLELKWRRRNEGVPILWRKGTMWVNKRVPPIEGLDTSATC